MTAILEDPSLYTPADGASRAGGIGKELEATKSLLEAAFTEWELVSAEVDEDVG